MLIYNSRYFLGKEDVLRVEAKYNAKYVGAWCIPDKNGNWSEFPVEVFFQPNPNTYLGHSNYFGLFISSDGISDTLIITNAASAFSEHLTGIVKDGVIYISHYRHDFIRLSDGAFIDGGRDYVRSAGETVNISINNDMTFTNINTGITYPIQLTEEIK